MWKPKQYHTLKLVFVLSLLFLFFFTSFTIHTQEQSNPLTTSLLPALNLLDSLDQELLNLKDKIQNLQVQKISLQSQIENLNKQIESLSTIKESYEIQIQDLNEKLQVLNQQLQELQIQLQELTVISQNQKIALEEYKSSVQDLEKSLQNLQVELNKVKKDIQILESKIKTERIFGWVKFVLGFILGGGIMYIVDYFFVL